MIMEDAGSPGIQALREALQHSEQLNAGLLRRAAELETANQELEAFSYSVSHDLRGPLRALDGFTTALLKQHLGQLNAEGQRLLMLAHDSVRQMERMIEDLLRLARQPLCGLHREGVDLSALAHEIAQELARREPGRWVRIRISPALRVSADPGLLRSVLYNLLDNAWKFTARQAEAQIEVGLGQREGQTTFFVRDNGAGFDMRYADRLFLPFRRLHRDEEFSGTGIGLATVQRIVRRHGGSIRAESAPGEGATFYFTLPE